MHHRRQPAIDRWVVPVSARSPRVYTAVLACLSPDQVTVAAATDAHPPTAGTRPSPVYKYRTDRK